jgi:TolA-binding protein
MTTCRTFGDVEQWARQGCDAELPLELRAHAAECLECRQLVSEVQRVRSAAAQSPVHQLSPSRLDSIEAVLRAEVRTVRPVAQGSSRSRRMGRWAAVVGTSILFGAVGMAAVVIGTTTPKPVTQSAVLSSAEGSVSRLGAARGHPHGSAASDPYPLDERVAELEVAAGEARAPTAALTPSASAKPVTKEQHREPDAARVPSDQGFANAYGLYQSGQAFAAAKAFDALLVGGRLDATRRCDALYWSAQAYARGVNASLAESRARSLLDSCPNGLRSGDAALLLGEYAEGRGDRVSARRFYRVAMSAAQPATRLRAREAFGRVGGE